MDYGIYENKINRNESIGMYTIESRMTGRILYPQHLGKIKKVYKSKLEADVAVKRLEPIVNPKRIDVVELSRSALAWLDNYYKTQAEISETHQEPKTLPLM